MNEKKVIANLNKTDILLWIVPPILIAAILIISYSLQETEGALGILPILGFSVFFAIFYSIVFFVCALITTSKKTFRIIVGITLSLLTLYSILPMIPI